MKLFSVNEHWELEIAEEAYGFPALMKIIKRDKSKQKERAMKELLFLWFYCDPKSDYLAVDEADRKSEIKRDIGLPEDWHIDVDLQAAMDFYTSHHTIAERLYVAAVKAAHDVANYLENTDELLRERSKSDTAVTKVGDITNALKSIPTIMKDLRNAYKEVVRESQESEGNKKGSQTFNTFEEGLKV